MIHIGEEVAAPFTAFRGRAEAGDRLVEFLGLRPDPDAAVLAVPRGGVTVAEPLARALGVPLELSLVRKLPVPGSPETGFGAVGLDGSVELNEPMVRQLGLSQTHIEPIVAAVLDEVRRRSREYVGHDRPPEVRGKRVYLVDDGLATGYTMIAAARMARRQEPERLLLAVPVSPRQSLDAAEPFFDGVHCLFAQGGWSFAVASYYADFHDMADREVRKILERSRRWKTD